jgi:hypothetical protein
VAEWSTATDAEGGPIIEDGSRGPISNNGWELISWADTAFQLSCNDINDGHTCRVECFLLMMILPQKLHRNSTCVRIPPSSKGDVRLYIKHEPRLDQEQWTMSALKARASA